ncbi:fibrobacter succinogenes major paralogous domain-containing protein [Subsaxibacter sp. CAU 1640]|uniref:fibrobacter succinogenes major paralogous domain-containing protein n=1 Tax=Subsaxibacter sp. CAU 1640 TaxID=2933271 RepID=UPI00200457CF|nr:fibrobacter succinogenes major paralogous domain-containing protein [Subsaxibacter sp. CAU 1640]MCK7591906.1 fibrobacter succinogenes major paralogous domain-containing protein [Subsaxibacter sp. CAU 1640]
MKKLMTAASLVALTLFSCSDDPVTQNDPTSNNPVETPTSNTLYRGVFTNTEGTKRGSIEMTVNDTDGMATAVLTLKSGATIELRSTAALYGSNDPILFNSTGSSDVSWMLITDSDGNNPIVTDVRFNNEDADVLMARSTAAAPATPVTGSYNCDNCGSIGVGFPNTNLTWNVMTIGEGDQQNIMTQVAYGGRVYTASTGSQSNCTAGALKTDCDVDGTFSILGYDVTWSGTHTYGVYADCSEISGTWAAPNYGSAPGAQGSFVSDSDCNLNVVDVDGNVYTYVTIDGMSWLSSNLNVSHYRNGDPIPHVQDAAAWASLTTGAWRYYNNDPSNEATYGKLYNWYAANDPRGLAPEGWHIPTVEELSDTAQFLGGATVAGGKLKSTTGWNAPNTGATNEFGYSALPGGLVNNNGASSGIGNNGVWWTSSATVSNPQNAFKFTMYYNQASADPGVQNKKSGLSIRCVRD